MIGLGSTGGGSGDSGIDALTNLLAVVSDPAASKSRLEALAVKTAEAKATLEKIAALNSEIDKKQAEIAAAQAGLNDGQDTLVAKDNDLKTREAKLALDVTDLVARQQAHIKEKQDFDDAVSAKAAELAKRIADVAKAEQDGAAKLNNAMAEADRILTDRQVKLEATYAEQLKTSTALQAEATKNRDATAAALAVAEEKKALYEKRLDALQKVIQGN